MTWISVKEQLPPFDEEVETKESDFRGEFVINLKRKAYSPKSPKFLRKIGWRWMRQNEITKLWDRHPGYPEFWRRVSQRGGV